MDGNGRDLHLAMNLGIEFVVLPGIEHTTFIQIRISLLTA